MDSSTTPIPWSSVINLPTPPDPVGTYSAVVIRGGLGFVSGQFPLSGGMMIRVAEGTDDSLIDAFRGAARVAALNVAAQIGKELGSWKRFGGLCRVEGVVAAPDGFTAHARVLDAASETFLDLFGPIHGAHARSAISSHSLPCNAAVELIVTFALATGNGLDQFSPASL